MQKQKIILASNNIGKQHEFATLLADLPWEIVRQTDLNLASVPETGSTFIENAIIKARYAAQITDLPALADDSGLVVDALNGAPGVISARYAGENVQAQDNIALLLENMSPIADENRQARFVCVLVYLRYAEDPCPLIAEAHWSGHILHAPQGTRGFGYDPVFYVPTHGCSAAELPAETKQTISHRGQAMRILKRQLAAEVPLLKEVIA